PLPGPVAAGDLGARRDRVLALDAELDELALHVAAVLEHEDRLLPQVAALLEGHGRALERGLLRIGLVVVVDARLRDQELDPERGPALRRRDRGALSRLRDESTRDLRGAAPGHRHR